jgi:hypothetical protein
MIVTANGFEVITDTSVSVPASNPPNFGIATVPAHALTSGIPGNIQAYAIHQAYGVSLYIRNLQPFTGGQNAYTTTFITPTDRATAVAKAKTELTPHTTTGILLHPCKANITGSQIIHVTWTCQFVTYHLPSYMHGTRVRLIGKSFLIDVVFVARPRPFPGK